MREKLLILQKNPCTTNFHPDGPGTLAEAERRGEERCPRYGKCWGADGDMGTVRGRHCALLSGHEIVMVMHKDKDRFRDVMARFRRDVPYPAKGYVTSRDRKTFTDIADHEAAMAEVERFAIEIIEGPAEGGIGQNIVRDDGNGPTISLAAMQECEGAYGYNGSIGCDTRVGHCSCGAGHDDVLKTF